MSSPIQNYIPCENHPTKLAKKYCNHEKCKVFLCNACVLSSHVDHIQDVQNLNTLYVSNTSLLNKLLSVSEKNKSFSKDLTFKCMNFVFHQAKHYCKQCNGFICNKCMEKHEKDHTFVSLEDYNNNFRDLIQFFISIINFDNSVGSGMTFSGIPEKYQFLEKGFDGLMKNVSDCKFRVNELIKKRNNFLLNYIEKLHKFYIRKQNLIAKNKDSFKKMIKIIDDIKFEKDEKKVFKYYIDFQMLVEGMFIQEDEKANFLKMYGKLNEIKEKINGLNESLLTQIESELKELGEEQINTLFGNVDKVIEEHNSTFKGEICKILNIDEEQYDKMYSADMLNKESKKYDEYEGPRKDLAPVKVHHENEIKEEVRVEEPKEEIKPQIVEKVIEREIIKEVNVTKNKFTDNDTVCVNNVCMIKVEGEEKKEEKPKEIIKEVIKEVYVEKEKREEKKPLVLSLESCNSIFYQGEEKKPIVEIPPQKEKIENSKEQRDTFEIQSVAKEPIIEIREVKKESVPNQHENKDAFSFIHEKIVVPNTTENNHSFTINNAYDKYVPLEKNNQQEVQVKVASPEIVSQPEKTIIETPIPVVNNETKSPEPEKKEEVKPIEEEVKPIEDIKVNEEESKPIEEIKEEENVITSSEPETKEEESKKEDQIIKPIPPNVIKMINSLMAQNPSLTETKQILSSISYPERNFLEIFALGQNCRTSFIFNPYFKKVEEIENNFPFKFPTSHSFLNIQPYVYISGGKNIDSSSGNDLNLFQKIQRSDDKNFIVTQLPSMLEARSSHTMVHISKLNSICAIAGSRLKSCELFSFESSTWKALPLLATSREKASACVINEEFLYVFFGFDRTKSKYVTTIERISLDTLSQWESISLPGNQNILKKQGLSSVPTKDGKILLVGGVNSLRNECKDILSFDWTNKKTSKIMELPGPCSFTHISFIQLTDGLWYNITENFEVVKYEMEENKFSFVK